MLRSGSWIEPLLPNPIVLAFLAILYKSILVYKAYLPQPHFKTIAERIQGDRQLFLIVLILFQLPTPDFPNLETSLT
ncbi:hypothetical protein BI308_10900 [Roseofilum reptotaenium AO1-A]|uniref:Uncharacterized protein n=1 Tax=Roseofilum reptotaenium AO1-A TaxID=1925591 RepID=A0A1L9QS75_9CYAN|nr:hypothetical protein BI308_10900 [Roseofilum reptotaenium AO1-A]